jgi:redox-sensitive bicupin YhaK (pirin superfamily)
MVYLEAIMDSQILIMAGLPLDEPIVHDGPFVMNTYEQIFQAWEDFESGKMGVISTLH